ncbi:MAG: biopolymer transporter ExbD [Akkermansia sp.]
MARHKKMEHAEDEDPGLDISSLIDVCFLLLIYFIVATTLVQERKLEMAMPGGVSSAEAKAVEPGLVRIDEGGTIYWGKPENQLVVDSDVHNHELPVLVDALNNLKTAAEAVDTKPVVQLWVESGVPHQRVIDVLNALAKAGIKSVGLTNFKDDN